MLRTKSTGFLTVDRVSRLLIAALAMTTTLSIAPARAAGGYQTHFGDGNIPVGCEEDLDTGSDRWWSQGGGGLTSDAWSDSKAVCHHQRTGQNFLDSPQIDVLIMAPATEPERSLRLAEQAIDMWEGGIHTLSRQMGLDWMADGVDFHVTVDQVDLSGQGTGEFTTYPIVDPEIVVVMGVNPVGTLGIGTTAPVRVTACHGIANPFDIETWEALPGWDSHHSGRDGIYTEDCGGSGGDTCFAVNTTIDTSVFAWDSMFDLVAHEVGHCLSVGHVGDGAEGGWGGLPPDDIMAYDEGVDGTKCVSTLNVESFALRMSNHLDVNGDGEVTTADVLKANNTSGGGYKNDGHPFQVMHPSNYFYASTTGLPDDCPQPDAGIIPGPRPDWAPVRGSAPSNAVLTVATPAEGDENQTGDFTVSGTLELVDQDPDPTVAAATIDDADDDASTPFSEITSLDVEATDKDLLVTLHLEDIWPTKDGASPVTYRVSVNDHVFNTYVYGNFGRPRTWDPQAVAYVDATVPATWDEATNTVSLKIPRAYLAGAAVPVTSPYHVSTTANVGALNNGVVDDRAPEGTGTVGVVGPESLGLRLATTPRFGGENLQVQTFTDDFDNTFFTEQSTLGVVSFFDDFVWGEPLLAATRVFELDVAEAGDVDVVLEWVDAFGDADLDLYVTGNGIDSGTAGATGTPPGQKGGSEVVHLTNVQPGKLVLAVEPYLITDVLDGATYTLTATVVADASDPDGDNVVGTADLCPNDPGPAPHGCPDGDGDNVHDGIDACPGVAGTTADGCPDQDGDGVADDDDACPGLPGPAATNGCPDGDGDGVHDGIDACPATAGTGPDGCPPHRLVVLVDDVPTAGDFLAGAPTEVLPFTYDLAGLVDGEHVVTVQYVVDGAVAATESRTVVHDPDDDDDGVLNDADACPGFDDAADLDGDTIPDGCDDDIDGDTVPNGSDRCPGFDDLADADSDGTPDGCDDSDDRPYVVHQETHPGFAYSNGWTALTNAQRSGGAATWTGDTGASLTLTFTGPKVQWVGAMGPFRGIARVTVDGREVAMVDQYAATWSYQQVLWSATDLGAGEHTLVITNTGTKNAKSAAARTEVDAIDAIQVKTPTPPPPGPSLNRFEEGDAAVTWSSGWSDLSNAERSGGAMRWTGTAGATATVQFTGTAVRWIGSVGPFRGIARVTIDGIDRGTVDQYADQSAFQQVLFEATGLTSGTHTLVITNTDAKNAKSAAARTEVDAIEAAATFA